MATSESQNETLVPYIKKSEFESLLEAKELFVMDCTASWCGPCRMVAPLMDKLAEEYKNQVKVVKLDVGDGENQSVAKKYGIRSIPAVMFFKNGELSETVVGVAAYDKFTTALDKILSPS
ncbi:MAG: thioredoxin [Aphanizomenon flos-aquae Clear-A1]|jgi:thioredoxin 1|uniref:Thioredoxin n=1 Tax=Aphanizomenon flos-aquae LD13 TaxID=1710894 RepID=A0A1B7VWB3_APHFL|nr:thioredoxin [Aphanizomenon flos-aquae Clear-A1]MBO1045954.1 thioredoxin [Aphanizomenon flos-aquae UKL13-PB]MBO1061600.1 thioredoxin [Aphanizomenon flos-aquae CP01]OBQ25217.1 MAG: thioredoxin [Aphanizomenon flos-aquae LD13]OBQ29365.1 MAG: thioredoxin [Aphanizomenon flos-aquae MDT14a]HCQ22371.1 thioredoxin [Anabaena sp. UBA12330]